MKQIAIFLGGMVLWCYSYTGAFALDYLREAKMPRAFWLAPKVYTGHLHGPVGEDGEAVSGWHIAQWGIRQEFPPQPICLDNCAEGAWRIVTDDAAVTVTTLPYVGRVVELRQDSSASEYGCGEFDLFMEPNEAHAYPFAPSGMIASDLRPTLAESQLLRISVMQEVITASQGNRCPAGYDLASTGFSFIFLNFSVAPPQVLYYQVITYDSRGLEFDKYWFANGVVGYERLEFGVSDSIQRLGFSALTPGAGAVGYLVDVLPRLKEQIASGPEGLDRNLEHWKLHGFYMGSSTNGAAAITSRYGPVRIVDE